MDFNRFSKSQNLYLWPIKPESNGSFLLTVAILIGAQKLLISIWLRMARMEMDCNLKS